jgi:glycosyltransferase involved in cell wall biosynthesis
MKTMAEKIRVAMLGSYPMDTSRIWGGVQAAYAYLVKGLSQARNLEIHILTIKPPDYSGPEQVERGNLTVHLLLAYPRFERLRNYRTYQTMINKKLAQIQPDLIHAQDAGADALVAIRSGLPAVVTVHGIRWEDGKHYRSVNKRVHNYFDSMFTERYVMRHARHLIAISYYVTDYFKGITRPDVEVFYVPNAIDERFFNLTKCPDEQVILFAGRVIPRKRVLDLVQAFPQVLKQVPSARLHIAGETSTEPVYVESIRRWAHQSHLDEYIRFLGPLTEEAVFQEFAGCSILALPSAQETAPMVIAQAMAARKPVVATRVGGVEEMVGEDSSRGFLVNVGNIDGLAIAITRLLQNPDLQAIMGQNGRSFAQEKYHPESVAWHTSDVYRRIAFKEQKTIV